MNKFICCKIFSQLNLSWFVEPHPLSSFDVFQHVQKNPWKLFRGRRNFTCSKNRDTTIRVSSKFIENLLFSQIHKCGLMVNSQKKSWMVSNRKILLSDLWIIQNCKRNDIIFYDNQLYALLHFIFYLMAVSAKSSQWG